MGKKSKPAAPPPPDYTAAAKATAASNQQAQTAADWANRPDQVDMYGNRTSWSATSGIDPASGQAINKWTQNVTLSPQQQAALDQQNRLQSGLMGTAEGMLGQAQAAVKNPMDWSQFQSMAGVPQAGNVQAGYLDPGQQVGAMNTQAGYLGAGNKITGTDIQAGNLQAGPELSASANNVDPNAYMTSGAGQGIMAGLDMGSLGAMPAADAAERQRIENMMFDRMRPEHQQAQAGLEAQVAGMGLTRGSAQWNREMQRLQDQQSRERFNAMEIGGNEMQRLHGMGMANRQQGWQELLGAGNFQNAAQAQGFGQNLNQNQQNFGMQAQAGQQNFEQQRAALMDNFLRNQQSGAQNFDQQARASAQNFGQASQSENDYFNRLAQSGQQNFAQNLAANNQNFGQQSQSVNDYFNRQAQAGNQNFQQNLAAGDQNYNQAMSSANYQNQLRQQQIAEAIQQRQMPLNELNAYMSGQQVGAPQYADFGQSRSAGGVDYSGAASQGYDAQMDAYNAKQQGKQGAMSGIGGLASAGIMAF